MNEKFNQNQTQFIAEEPLLEKPTVPAPIAQPVIKPRPPKWLWWLGGGLLLLLIVVLIMVWRNGMSPAPTSKSAPAPVEERVLSPLEQRLETAKQLLNNANPTTQELPFPPLNMELRIDPISR